MNVTEVSICLPPHSDKNRSFLAFASILLDDNFAVHDLRVIALPSGRLFVSMPSRSRKTQCPHCQHNTPMVLRCCGHCGELLPSLTGHGKEWRSRNIMNVAYPVNQSTRKQLETAILHVFLLEQKRSREANYVRCWSVYRPSNGGWELIAVKARHNDNDTGGDERGGVGHGCQGN